MQSPLGYTSAGLACVPVKNFHTDPIPFGAVCSLYFDTAATVIGEEQTVIWVVDGTVDAQLTAGMHNCGIALGTMAPRGGGTICMLGPCLAMAGQDATPSYPAYSEALEVEANGRTLVDRDSGTIVGVTLGDAALGADLGYGGQDFGPESQYYVRAWVNFVSSASFGYT